MFRRLYESATRLLARPRASDPLVNDLDLAQDVREPDPYIWRLPNPYDARWRRWARRSRAAGYRLPFPCREECWQGPARPQAPSWSTDDGVVRPYVLRP